MITWCKQIVSGLPWTEWYYTCLECWIPGPVDTVNFGIFPPSVVAQVLKADSALSVWLAYDHRRTHSKITAHHGRVLRPFQGHVSRRMDDSSALAATSKLSRPPINFRLKFGHSFCKQCFLCPTKRKRRFCSSILWFANPFQITGTMFYTISVKVL